MTEVSPINHICVSQDGKFVELWNNGNRIRTQYIPHYGSKEVCISEAQEYFMRWSGFRASVEGESNVPS